MGKRREDVPAIYWFCLVVVAASLWLACWD